MRAHGACGGDWNNPTAMEKWKAGPTLQREWRRRRLQHALWVTDCRPCMQSDYVARMCCQFYFMDAKHGLSRHRRKGGDSNHSKCAVAPRVQIPGREKISDVYFRYELEMPAVESQVGRARMRYAASLIRRAQPSAAALLSVGRKAPADWASMLLVDLESLRTVCPLFQQSC